MRRSSALWFIPPLMLGIAAAIWFVRRAPEPGRIENLPAGMAVRALTLEAQTITPVARGWGNVRAAATWTAVSEVKGRVIWQHPDLETGKLITAGTKVLQIDPGDYQLAIAQAEADLAAFSAELALLDAEAENTAHVLELEKDRLRISEADLARNRNLLERGTTAQARVEEVERATILARRTVVELKNALALIGPRRSQLEAQVARTDAARARALRDLDHTVLTAPFDLRVTDVPVELFQYVNIGQTLASGDGVEQAEIVAHIPFAAFRRLLHGTEPIEETMTAVKAGPSERLDAEVQLVSDATQVWAATVSRIEGALDPRARTVPVVVSVDGPYNNANPPFRPPLLPNMQVEVTLSGQEIPAALVIPEATLHGSLVYVIDADEKLELRAVTEAFRQEGIVVVSRGLSAGERVVLDDISPAIPGMLLDGIEVPR